MWQLWRRAPLGIRTAGRWFGYVVVLALALGLTVAYAHRRDLRHRCQRLEQDRIETQRRLRECEALEQELDESRSRLESREDNPLETEADSRSSKNLVREGETVYRFQQGAAAPCPGGSSPP